MTVLKIFVNLEKNPYVQKTVQKNVCSIAAQPAAEFAHMADFCIGAAFSWYRPYSAPYGECHMCSVHMRGPHRSEHMNPSHMAGAIWQALYEAGSYGDPPYGLRPYGCRGRGDAVHWNSGEACVPPPILVQFVIGLAPRQSTPGDDWV